MWIIEKSLLVSWTYLNIKGDYTLKRDFWQSIENENMNEKSNYVSLSYKNLAS